MDRGGSQQTDAGKRLSARFRALAFWTGILGLIIDATAFSTYWTMGKLDLPVVLEVLVYAAVLSVITVSAHRRYRVREILFGGLVTIFTIFWISSFVEASLGYVMPFDLPLILFVPLFLVFALSHKLLFALAPVQLICTTLYTHWFVAGNMNTNWSSSDQLLFSFGLGAVSGFSFCALGVIALAREFSDQKLVDLVAEKEKSASTDVLTGLMNRRAFMTSLRREWSSRTSMQVVFIDLDHFKPLNDQFGHAAGDEVLRTIAARINNSPLLSHGARLGGDEFAAMVLTDDCDQSKARVLDTIHALLTSEIESENGFMSVGASIGYAGGDTVRQTLSGILRSADTAMRRAKNGRLRWALFDPAIDNQALVCSTLEVELKAAIQNGRIRAAVQPIADARTLEVRGYELLARWPDSGFERDPGPAEFVPIAEKLGLLSEILWQTLDEALSALDLSERRLSINVSPAQLLAADFLPKLIKKLGDHDVDPSAITIEVTEEVAYRNVERNVEVLRAARELGIRVSLDDFGTGYSSLSMLDTLPLDALKIDQSFVRKFEQSEQSRRILLATIRLAKQLGLQSVVEGIENQEFAERISVLGADFVQGYWLGKPQLVCQMQTDIRMAS